MCPRWFSDVEPTRQTSNCAHPNNGVVRHKPSPMNWRNQQTRTSPLHTRRACRCLLSRLALISGRRRRARGARSQGQRDVIGYHSHSLPRALSLRNVGLQAKCYRPCIMIVLANRIYHHSYFQHAPLRDISVRLGSIWDGRWDSSPCQNVGYIILKSPVSRKSQVMRPSCGAATAGGPRQRNNVSPHTPPWPLRMKHRGGQVLSEARSANGLKLCRT